MERVRSWSTLLGVLLLGSLAVALLVYFGLPYSPLSSAQGNPYVGATVAFGGASSSGLESATPADLEVTLSAASGQTVTVDYGVTGGTATGSGVDFTLDDGTLTFAAGDTSETISIVIVDDASEESDETIEVTLSNPSNATLGGPAVHTYTINDDELPPTGGCGDVHPAGGGDGDVDVLDALRSLKIAVGIVVPSTGEQVAGDVHPNNDPDPDGDGDNDVLDTLRILKAAVGSATITSCGGPQ